MGKIGARQISSAVLYCQAEKGTNRVEAPPLGSAGASRSRYSATNDTKVVLPEPHSPYTPAVKGGCTTAKRPAKIFALGATPSRSSSGYARGGSDSSALILPHSRGRRG